MTDKASVAHEFYVKGNEHRKRGDMQAAINCYTQAMELDADSPAATAKAMLENILNYYHKDAYNP